MAIRINAGTAPKYGRITMPKGTFLNSPQPKFSNPATSADGGTSGGGGETPPKKYNPFTAPTSGGGYTVPQVPVDQPSLGGQGKGGWEESFWNPKSPADFFFGVKGWLRSVNNDQSTSQGQQFYTAGGVPIQGYAQTEEFNGIKQTTYNPVAFDRQGNRYTWDANSQKYVRDETGALAQNNLQKTPNSPTNGLVGTTPDSAPNEMTSQQALQLFPNLSPTEVAQVMTSKGYEAKYMPGVGGVWVKTGQASTQPQGAVSGTTDNRGRPTWVDPTLLQPGERVTAASGLTYVGGTPTASGQAQYAVTLPQSKYVTEDTHGNFKWQSYTKQDESGNWVRVYYKALRKVRTARGRRNIALRGAQQQATQTPQQASDSEALVTLRANYG